MKLVSSNEPSYVKETIQEASRLYKEKSDVSGALKILTKLKGIGPATASLLLAVLDPERVIFFADEAFYWLCCGGKQGEIKYNAKEYDALCARAHELCKRLDVRAVDVEKVAYVMMKRRETEDTSEAADSDSTTADGNAQEDPKPKVTTTNTKGQQPGKRKARSDEDEEAEGDQISPPPPARRSKRIQKEKKDE
jgi:hypothetical protein